MKVGYCVPHTPHMASYRLRVAIPAPLLGCEYEIGCPGEVSFFYKHFEGDIELARSAGPFVFDVVNDHFGGKFGDHYRWMTEHAATVTVSSDEMARTVKRWTGRDAVVIDDPYENEELPPEVVGNEVLWFGHSANIGSLFDVVDDLARLNIVLAICTNSAHPGVISWNPETERRSLARAAVVLVTGNNRAASANRIVKALRAGRFPVAPAGTPAWDELRDYCWIGDVREGIEWALKNREEACARILAGQECTRLRFDPHRIAKKWMEAFDSISGAATSASRDGLQLIS